jgi:hypothetical protein
MNTLIYSLGTGGGFPSLGVTFLPAFDENAPEPLEYQPGTTLPISPTLPDDSEATTDRESPRRFAPPRRTFPPAAEADSTPLQIWEGTVVEVDNNARVMRVNLDAKIGLMPRHMGEIDLEWVTEQDQDLVRPGAVFYLTLFKRTKRGSVENAQELRFRRRPAWSSGQLRQVEHDAEILLSKIKPLPTWE